MENAIIIKEDKGKTSVITYSDDYAEKIYIFLSENKFHTVEKNPTDKYQKLLTKTLQQCDHIINKKLINHLLWRKPQPPTLKAQLKLHRPGNPIRPVINNMNAPSCKISKHLANILNGYLNLNHLYNVKNSTSLAEDLTKFKIDKNCKMLTHDVSTYQ